MNKKVTEYIKKQKEPQKEICNELRKIILKTFPNIKEDMKMGVPWYEEMFYIVSLKDSVNLGFSVKGFLYSYLSSEGEIHIHSKEDVSLVKFNYIS